MRKTLFTLLALLLSFTAASPQLRPQDSGAAGITVAQQSPGMLKSAMTGKTASRIAMDADERIMGYYDSDLIGENALGFGVDCKAKAAVEFTPATIGNFVGGQITKVRFAVNRSVGASKVTVSTVSFDGNTIITKAEVDVPSTEKGWNDVVLPAPVTVESGVDYLISYDFNSTSDRNDYPLTLDQGVNPNGGVDGGCLVYGDFLGRGEQWYNNGTSYGNFCIQAVVKGGTFADEDITIGSLSASRFIKAGQSTAFSYTIKNNGSKMPSSYTIDLLLDGNVIQTADNPIDIANTSQTVNATVTLPAGTATGKHTLAVKVAKINGKVPADLTEDDMSEMNINVYTESMPRQKNLVEQFTSTRCIYCPLAGPVLDALKELRGGDVVVVAHHDNIPERGDPMMTDEAVALSGKFNMTGNTCAMFNRYFETDLDLNSKKSITHSLGYSGNMIEPAAAMLNQIIDDSNQMPAFASVNIRTAFDESTRELSVEVSGSGVSDFNEAVGEDAMLSVFLTEDGIVAKQANQGAIIEDYVHNNVMRKALSDTFGSAINWNGNTYSNTYSITLPAEWDAANMHVVAFINRPAGSKAAINDVYVNNANTCRIGETSSGIDSPVTDKGNGTEVARYTIDGRRISKPVKGINIVRMSDGRTVKVIVR